MVDKILRDFVKFHGQKNYLAVCALLVQHLRRGQEPVEATIDAVKYYSVGTKPIVYGYDPLEHRAQMHKKDPEGLGDTKVHIVSFRVTHSAVVQALERKA